MVRHMVRVLYARTMAEAKNGRRLRRRGEVEELPSGALRVKVYAGEDSLTGRRHYLRETVPAGPTAARDAERARALDQLRKMGYAVTLGPLEAAG